MENEKKNKIKSTNILPFVYLSQFPIHLLYKYCVFNTTSHHLQNLTCKTTNCINVSKSPGITELLPMPLCVECILLMGQLILHSVHSDQVRAFWKEAWKPLLISLTWGNMRVWRPGNHLSQRCLPVLHIRFDWAVITFTATSAAILHKCDLICDGVVSWRRYSFSMIFFFCQLFILVLQYEKCSYCLASDICFIQYCTSHTPQFLKHLLFFWCTSSGISWPRWSGGGIREHDDPAQLPH